MRKLGKSSQLVDDLEGGKMSRKRRHLEKPENKKQIVQATKLRLFLLIAFLIVALAVSFLYRSPFTAIILFIVIFLTLLSPVIIEFTNTPRTYPGPGKNPQGPWDP
jgi:pilus assembly protein TadC